MKMKKQKITFTISPSGIDGQNIAVNMDISPGLLRPGEPGWEQLTDEQKSMQGMAATIALAVGEHLRAMAAKPPQDEAQNATAPAQATPPVGDKRTTGAVTVGSGA